jgi:hypothetical protein
MLKKALNTTLHDSTLVWIQFGLILVFSCVPLFVQLPFKINLFLAWEGAYRLSIGQIPFKDFSLPLGFGFWVLPALFFKIFGPFLHTLLITQAVINIIGALSLRGILKKLGLSESSILFSLLIYCISFVFVNFWPWYNNTVFIFQLIATNFLLAHILSETNKKKIIYLFISVFFLTLALFTKQDGGGLAILSASSLLFYDALINRKIKWMLYYFAFFLLFASIFVIPFLSYDFGYWFNYGQSPHNARTSLDDILIDVFEGSQWIKFYMLATLTILIVKASNTESYFQNRKEMLLFLFTISILVQALLVQVTSYIPHNVNIYFHSIAFAFLCYHSINSNIDKVWAMAVLICGIMFWWSSDYWRYSQRIIHRMWPAAQEEPADPDRISKYTWSLPDSSKAERKIKWKLSHYKSFKNVLLPEETIQGIDSLMGLEVVKKQNLKVLNMSELTPLSYELGFVPLKNQPLWFHRNVSIFDKEILEICQRISSKDYDLVLFEVIPNLNQFYPKAVRESLQTNYIKIMSFQAPRDYRKSIIEVYRRP